MGSTTRRSAPAKRVPTRRKTAGIDQKAEQGNSNAQAAGSKPASRSTITSDERLAGEGRRPRARDTVATDPGLQSAGVEGSTPSHRTTQQALERLNPKRRAFALEYQKDRNATKAYMRAGYTSNEEAARTNAARLLANAHVAAAIKALTDETIEQAQAATGITLERTLQEIAKLAFFDPRKLFDAAGEPLPMTEIDDDTAAAISGLDVLEQFEGTGKERRFVGMLKKYKLSDKKPALDMLMKHLGGYERDRSGAVDTLAALLGTFQRSALPIVQTPNDDGEDA